MRTFLLFLSIGTVFFLSCATLQHQEKPEAMNLLYIDGTVQRISGTEVTLQLNLPELKKTPGSPIGEIAWQVVQKSILLEGMKTEINKKSAFIREVRGSLVKAEMAEPASWPPGTVVTLDVPKKTIAVVDFEVIKGKEKEVGRVTLEGLTSALIDSGQFAVVERSKLKSVMEELQLSASGMTKATPEKTLGKLLFADLILTGTLAETRGEWDINLRLLNTRTGQAMSAITLHTNLFKPSEIRDAGTLGEDFEALQTDPSWIMRRVGKIAYVRTIQDRSGGADSSKKSIRVDFNFVEGERPDFAAIDNRKKRDLSLYDGIEFFAKATDTLRGQATIFTSQPDDPNKMDAWSGFFQIDNGWEKIRIPFNQLIIGRRWIKEGAARQGATPGDQVMRLNRVESFQIGVQQGMNGEVKGSFWIDKIRFYTD